MPKVQFSVDSALLRELGERLVGRPQIALAELIKNSYDADATTTVVTFGSDAAPWIQVADDGHGMSEADFKKFWMRVGSPHKEKQAVSPGYQRPLTGSKGIGRLAAQFLAKKIDITTKSANQGQLRASVDWREAVEAGSLTQAEATYSREQGSADYPGGAKHGTVVRLTDLNQSWGAAQFEDLAREIWTLQPPFDPSPRDVGAFQIELIGPDRVAVERFRLQLRAALELWHARIVGQIQDDGAGGCEIALSLKFEDGSTRSVTYKPLACDVHFLSFEIRVFSLFGRQRSGIRVDEARTYLNRFGGVHVYDAGFHLPYYGPETDWLRIEFDHSHRLSRSQLLPTALQVSEGLNYLPTNSRLYGVVRVDTGLEHRQRSDLGEQALTIQVSRDRLVDNEPYRTLSHAVRWAVDYYAMQEAAREYRKAEALRDVEPIDIKVSRVEGILERSARHLPTELHERLVSEVGGVVHAAQTRADSLARQTGLLGALATAGISALALEHETRKHIHALRDLIPRASNLATTPEERGIVADLETWIRRVEDTRRLFEPLLDAESAAEEHRLFARPIAQEVVAAVRPLTGEVTHDLRQLDGTVVLPPATYAEWFSLFQNVLLNAANAMADASEKRIKWSSAFVGGRQTIVVQDTGVGVDLGSSEDLFQPFVRKLDTPEERRYLGLGGSGLGLTIVRLIAKNRGCVVRFIPPDDGFATAFQLAWREDD